VRGGSAKRAVVVGAFVALACLLFLLIAGLNNLELLPGRPLPNLSQSPESERTASRPLATRPSDVSGLVVVLVAGGLAVGIAVSLLFRDFRRRLLKLLITACVLLLMLWFVNPFARQPIPSSESSPAATASPDSAVGPSLPKAPPLRASNGLVILVAIGAAGLVTGLGFVVWRAARLHLATRLGPGVLDELAEEAGKAAQAIQAGDDPRDAVLRCYKEMCAILAREGNVHDIDSLTPREFAVLLRAHGMGSAHADRLTWIFEEVRYGSRPSTPLAAEAIACLEAVRMAHAAENA